MTEIVRFPLAKGKALDLLMAIPGGGGRAA